MSNGARRPMVVSRLWVQGMVLTFLVGFAILGYLAGPLLFQGRKDWLREETKGLLAPDY